MLTVDSLSEKFTASGDYHDEAFAHLRQLGLKEMAAESGANELGRRLRLRFIQPFSEANAAR